MYNLLFVCKTEASASFPKIQNPIEIPLSLRTHLPIESNHQNSQFYFCGNSYDLISLTLEKLLNKIHPTLSILKITTKNLNYSITILRIFHFFTSDIELFCIILYRKNCVKCCIHHPQFLL